MRRTKQLLPVCPKNGPRRDCCQSPWTCLRSHECRLDCLLAPRGAHCVWARERGPQKAACALRASSGTAEHPNETRTLCYHFATQLGSTARNGPEQYGTLEPNSVTNPVLVGTLPPLREAKSSTAKQGSTPIAVALITGGCQFLQLAAELAIERIRTAAAQRDGKAQQPPQQHIFVTAAHPAG